MDAGPRPLTGLAVVDLCTARAGSVAGMLLADLGADVARPLVPGGAHDRPAPTEDPDPVCWDRGKHPAEVGSLHPEDPGLRALLDGADLVLLDGPPAMVEGRAFDPEALRSDRPRLAVVWLPPYGARGQSYRDLPADPLLLSAVSGYAMHQPAVDPTVPIAPVIPVVEYVQGALAAAAGVAGALERERSGIGQVATVSGLDAAGALIATLVNESLDVEKVFRTSRNSESGPSFRPYRCGDGETLFLATLIEPLFVAALGVLDLLEVMLLDGVDGEFLHLFRPEVGPAAARMLEERFASQPRAYWLERLEAAGVPVEPVQSRDAWLASRQFAAAAGVERSEHPAAGEVTTPGVPVRFGTRPAAVDPAGVWPARPGGAGPGPLAGLRVVDLATFVAGPYAPAVLATWGADVVKVEPPSGDPYGVYTVSYLAVNHGKRSSVLDQQDPDGRRAFEALLAGADVLVDNLRPSARAKLRLEPDDLDRINPGLVSARVTAFGDAPDVAERPGFDPSIQALSGMMVAAGGRAKPLNTTTPVHDVASSCLVALGVLAALWHRTRTGEVLTVGTSLAAASALLQCAELTDFPGRPAPAVGGIDFVGASAGRRFYRAADGWVGLAARTADELRAAAAALGASLPARPDDAPDGPAAAALGDAFARLPAAAALDALGRAAVPASAVVGPDWETDEHLVANGFSSVVVDPAFGRCRILRPPGDWSRSGRSSPERMAARGADTERLRTAGWDALT